MQAQTTRGLEADSEKWARILPAHFNHSIPALYLQIKPFELNARSTMVTSPFHPWHLVWGHTNPAAWPQLQLAGLKTQSGDYSNLFCDGRLTGRAIGALLPRECALMSSMPNKTAFWAFSPQWPSSRANLSSLCSRWDNVFHPVLPGFIDRKVTLSFGPFMQILNRKELSCKAEKLVKAQNNSKGENVTGSFKKIK